MALVESRHYTDDDAWAAQVGRYDAPPVRLQRGGIGKLAVAFAAATAAVAAMVVAVTTTPQGDVAPEVVMTLESPLAGAVLVEQENRAVARSNLYVSQQLAQIAGAEVPPADAVVDLNASAAARKLARPSSPSQDESISQPVSNVGRGDAALDKTASVPTSSKTSQKTDAIDPGELPTLEGREVSLEMAMALIALEDENNPQANEKTGHDPVKSRAENIDVPLHVPSPKAKPDPSMVLASTAVDDQAVDNEADATKLRPPAERPAEEQFLKVAATPAASPSRYFSGGTVLNPAPYAPITERSASGLLPVVSKTGEDSRHYYARPFPANETRPRISLVIGGLGLSQKATNAAIEELPADVTLAFAPYGKNLQTYITRARSRGHEVLLELPMEPFDYPSNDPGPFTLLSNNDTERNLQRLEWLLAQFNGYVGVTNYLGARFTSNAQALLPVLRELDERGLLVLDDGTSNRSQIPSLSRKMNVPFAEAARTIDMRVSRSAIDDALLELEDIARRKGAAVGMGFAYPVTIDRIQLWAQRLEQKGFVLAPVSANVREPVTDTRINANAESY